MRKDQAIAFLSGLKQIERENLQLIGNYKPLTERILVFRNEQNELTLIGIGNITDSGLLWQKIEQLFNEVKAL